MKTPSFDFERHYWEQGISPVSGIDEVGMGALAGPVVAGAVIFDAGAIFNFQFSIFKKMPIRDSKTLSEKQREKAAIWIKDNALAWAIGEASVEEIYALNILQAARLAMKRAVEQLSQTPSVLIIDGRPPSHEASVGLAGRTFALPSEYVIKGDQKSFSIAAASIVAKVHRDQIMRNLAEQYPGYGFENHKGYGSKEHQEALKTQGVCACHRRAYAPIRALALTKPSNPNRLTKLKPIS